MTHLTEYPNLPILPIDVCFAIFARANISVGKLSKISGFSRMGLYKWRESTATPLSHNRERVSLLAYRVLRATLCGKAPFTPSASVDDILSILINNLSAKALCDYTAEELLTADLLKQITTEA